jgi:transcriptional regulator with XRE-family HTH domain
MDGDGVLGQLRRVRDRMMRQGASTEQIAAAIIEAFDVNPRVAFRHALGLTQSQVADRYNQRWPHAVPKTRKEISYWECWQGPGHATSSSSARTPSYEDLVRLAQLYGCLVDDLLVGPRRNPNPSATTVPYQVITDILSNLKAADYAEDLKQSGDEAIVTLRAPVGEGSIIVRLSRRQFTELLATGGLAALLPDAALAPAMADTNLEGVASWRRILTAHQAGHHLLAPHAHITTLTDTLARISAARDDAGPNLRRQLRRLQAEYAEHISWLHRETADLASCWRWADRAASWALETGDTAMATYMMLRRATVALDQDDHARAGELAQAAQHANWDTPPALNAAAHLYQARAQAATGIIAERELDRADELLAAGHQPDDPAYLRFYTTDFGELQRATCYLTAGLPARAVTILQARLTALSATNHRDRAVHLARLGAAHTADQAPDAAAIAGLGALTETSRAGSLHALTELEHLDAALRRRWPRQPKVGEFHDALHAAQMASSNRHAT